MVQPRKLLSGKVAYYMTFTLLTGERKWRHGGFDKQAAEREEKRLREAAAAGLSTAPPTSKQVRVADWFEPYLDGRKGRAAENEAKSVADHVLSLEWFAKMRVVDVRPADCLRVVEAIRAKGMSEKYIGNIWTVVAGGFAHAAFHELRTDNPAAMLPKGTIKRKKVKRRFPYQRAEVLQLLQCSGVSWPMQVFIALLVYTGMRKGEVCGRRWHDYQPVGTPLGGLLVHTQYDDQPLKGDDDEVVRPRTVPVHPELKRKLDWWWAEGFELFYLRKPTREDFIVPTSRAMINHTESSAYKAFRTALKAAGVGNRTLHSTRHTFISVARSSGADSKLVEKITHNAAGTTLDDYTDYEWEALCGVMGFVDYSVERNAKPVFFRAPTQGLEAQAPTIDSHESPSNAQDRGAGLAPQISSRKPALAAFGDGGQRAVDSDEADFAVALGEHLGARPPARATARTEPAAEWFGLKTYIEFRGERRTVTDFAAAFDRPKKTVAMRLNMGWSVERALTEPIDASKSSSAPRARRAV